MKRNCFYFEAFCLVGMMACMTACSDENFTPETATDNGSVLTSVMASMPTDASSRVTLADGTSSISQLWKTGDKIFINNNQTDIKTENQFTLDKGAGSATGATFKGELTYGTSATKFFAYYPASDNWTKGTTSGVMAFNFANQDGTLEGLANFAVMAAVAPISAPSFQFHNMTALMKFNITFPGESSAASADSYFFTQAKMYNNGKPAYESEATHKINWYPQDKETLGGIHLALSSTSAAITNHKSTVYFAMPAGWGVGEVSGTVYHQASTKNMIIRVPVSTGNYAGIIGKDQPLEPGKMYTVSKKLVAAQYANAEATTFTDNNTGDFWLIESTDATCLGNVETALNALKTANSTRKITLVMPAYTTNVPKQFAQDCTNLEKAYFPAVTGEIPYRTFAGCTSLTTFSAPYATSVGTDGTSENVFNGCTALTNVDIPNVTTIGTNAFDGCSALTSINLPKVTSIGANAFANSALTEINLPMLQTITGGEVFLNCTHLTKITLGGGTDWGGFTGINTANTTSLFNGLGNSNCSLYLPAGQTVSTTTPHTWTVLLKDGTKQTQTINVSVFQHVYVGGTQVF